MFTKENLLREFATLTDDEKRLAIRFVNLIGCVPDAELQSIACNAGDMTLAEISAEIDKLAARV